MNKEPLSWRKRCKTHMIFVLTILIFLFVGIIIFELTKSKPDTTVILSVMGAIMAIIGIFGTVLTLLLNKEHKREIKELEVGKLHKELQQQNTPYKVEDDE